MKNKEIEELLNSIDEIIKEAPDKAIYGIQIKEYKQIKNYIEQLEKKVEEYDFLITMQNNREYRSKFLKEFQEEHGKNVFPDYDEIYKRYDKLKKENKELEINYKEANDSITWWTNRYNAIVKQNDDNHKKVVKLENNRDKAIEYVESHFIFNGKTGECYQTHTFDKENVKKLYDILKGDSDDTR